jgi:carboxypeptidase C (cathepsin A)
LDQPVPTGFSHRGLRRASSRHTLIKDATTTNSDEYSTRVVDVSDDEATGIYSLKGVVSPSSESAAYAVWLFLQVWFEAFPKYLPQKTGFHLFTESYGGHYGPAIADHIMSKNEATRRGEIKSTIINLQTLGIGNGLIDSIIQFPYGPLMWVHNSYGITAADDVAFARAMRKFLEPGQCKSLIHECRIRRDPIICRGMSSSILI